MNVNDKLNPIPQGQAPENAIPNEADLPIDEAPNAS